LNYYNETPQAGKVNTRHAVLSTRLCAEKTKTVKLKLKTAITQIYTTNVTTMCTQS